jgi:hypothetical protein
VTFSNAFEPSQSDTQAGFHYFFTTDQTALANATYANSGTSTSASFTFDDDGSYTVYGRIINEDNASTDYSTVVVVNPVAPTATLSNNGPVTEGTPVTVTFSNPFEPSQSDTQAGFHYAFATDAATLANATYANSGTSQSASFTFNEVGSYTVFGRILNEDGVYTDYMTTVTVQEAIPVASLTGPDYGRQHKPVTFTFQATDSSPIDQAAGFTFQIDWGDGNTQTVTGQSGLSVSHVYAHKGDYTIGVTATDDGGTSALATTQIDIGSGHDNHGHHAKNVDPDHKGDVESGLGDDQLRAIGHVLAKWAEEHGHGKHHG